MDKETQDNIVDEFRDRIIKEKGDKAIPPKRITWDCWCCHKVYNSVRRDLTWSMVVSLIVLKEMEDRTGQHFHKFRDVWKECEEGKYRLMPSDQSFLKTKWGLLEHADKTVLHYDKFVGLTKKGYEFLKNNYSCKQYFYTEPVTKQSLFSKSTVDFKTICNTGMDDKDERNPFYNED